MDISNNHLKRFKKAELLDVINELKESIDESIYEEKGYISQINELNDIIEGGGTLSNSAISTALITRTNYGEVNELKQEEGVEDYCFVDYIVELEEENKKLKAQVGEFTETYGNLMVFPSVHYQVEEENKKLKEELDSREDLNKIMRDSMTEKLCNQQTDIRDFKVKILELNYQIESLKQDFTKYTGQNVSPDILKKYDELQNDYEDLKAELGGMTADRDTKIEENDKLIEENEKSRKRRMNWFSGTDSEMRKMCESVKEVNKLEKWNHKLLTDGSNWETIAEFHSEEEEEEEVKDVCIRCGVWGHFQDEQGAVCDECGKHYQDIVDKICADSQNNSD